MGLWNCTVHNLRRTQAGDCTGIEAGNAAKYNVQNCICTDVTAAGTANCYVVGARATNNNNLSSDTTASGTGSLTSKTATNQFVSIVGGSEDLHLKTGADAIDAGTDLGTTPTGVNIDIDGRDRDLEGDTWDIGADEFVSAASTQMTFTQIHFAPFSGGLA